MDKIKELAKGTMVNIKDLGSYLEEKGIDLRFEIEEMIESLAYVRGYIDAINTSVKSCG